MVIFSYDRFFYPKSLQHFNQQKRTYCACVVEVWCAEAGRRKGCVTRYVGREAREALAEEVEACAARWAAMHVGVAGGSQGLSLIHI